MKKVFVSYSRINLEIVTLIVQDLQATGIDVWYDQTLTGGQRWWDNILGNLCDSELFIFALSPESLDSEACKSELGYVSKLGKPILPVLVAEGVNVNLLSPPLNEIQVTDYRKGSKEASFALVKSIYTAPSAPPLPDPLPASPAVPVSYLSNLKERIESSEPLSAQNQITLLFELEEDLRDGHSPAEIRALLLRLKRRDDLLAKISTKIDAALKSLEERLSAQKDNKTSTTFTSSKYCPKCGTGVQEGQKFCPSCGTSLTQSNVVMGNYVTSSSTQENAVPVIAGSKCRKYVCLQLEAQNVIANVKNWLNVEGFDSQQINTENQTITIQIKKRGSWRSFVGMATSLNIVFHHANDTLTMQIGAGKWMDKTIGGTIGLLVLWPLAITAGFGIWDQMKMPEKIFDYVGAQLISRS